MSYYRLKGKTKYNLGITTSVEYPTTSTMQRHIVQASDGVLAAIIQRGNPAGTPVAERGLIFIRSIDNGVTWTIDHQLTSSDLFTADMEIDANNAIYAIYTQNADSAGANKDAGFRKFTYDAATKTWSMGGQILAYDAPVSGLEAATWSNIAKESVSGRLWVSFRHYNSTTGIYTIKMYYSDNDGATWTDTALSIGHNNTNLTRYGTIVSTSEVVMLVFHDTDATPTEWKRYARHYISEPATSWTIGDIGVAKSNGYGTHYSVVPDPDGTIHVVYEDREIGVETDVYYTRYFEDAWETPYIVGIGGGSYPNCCFIEDTILGIANTHNNRRLGSKSLDIIAELFSRAQFNYFEELYYDQVLLYAGTVEDKTNAAKDNDVANDVVHSATGALVKDIGDYVSLKHSVQFDYVYFALDQAGIGGTVVWEYWNGAGYSNLAATDSLDSNFTGSTGYLRFTPPGNWTAAGGYFEIRARVTVAYTTIPKCGMMVPSKYRRRLAIPAFVDLTLSNNLIPSIIREGEVSANYWNLDVILWEVEHIQLSENFFKEIKKAPISPNVIFELKLDGGVKKVGFGNGNFSDVSAIVETASSTQNKIDTSKGYSTRGEMEIVLTGRENIKALIKDNYLLNRRVLRRDGFITSNFTYEDYATTFVGKIIEWGPFKGDRLTIRIADTLKEASSVKIPEENSTKTQFIDYTNWNPADIMKNLLQEQIKAGFINVNGRSFDAGRDLWLNGWKFSRVITDPKGANEYLNELQIETNSFIFHDGEKLSFKVFSPPLPTETIEEWTDDHHIALGSFSQDSGGYKEHLFNRVVFYFDYDESGSDGETNFETGPLIVMDESSQAQWKDVKSKVIKSKWIRSFTFAQTVPLAGVRVYHISKANGAGTGTLTFTKASNTLQYTPPGGSIGEAVTLQDGKADVYGSDKSKYIRVLTNAAELPAANATGTITISALNGQALASAISHRIINRYRDPSALVKFDVMINQIAYDNRLVSLADLKDITTEDACEKGASSWTKKRIIITSARPDFQNFKIGIEGMDAKIFGRYAFITAAGYPDYPVASEEQRRRGFIGDANGKINGGTEEGYRIW